MHAICGKFSFLRATASWARTILAAEEAGGITTRRELNIRFIDKVATTLRKIDPP